MTAGLAQPPSPHAPAAATFAEQVGDSPARPEPAPRQGSASVRGAAPGAPMAGRPRAPIPAPPCRGRALGPRAPSGPRVQGEPGSRRPTGRAGRVRAAGHAPLPAVRCGEARLSPVRPGPAQRRRPLPARPGLPGAARAPWAPQAARRSRAPPAPVPRARRARAHSPSHRSASSSGLGARRPMLARRSCSPPPPSSPPPLLLLLLQLRLLQSRRSSAWAARLLRSPREPINPGAGAYVRPGLRSRPPASHTPAGPPSCSRPGPGAGPPIPVCSPDRSAKAKGKSRSARPPAPPIRLSASNKHKLSQAPPRSSGVLCFWFEYKRPRGIEVPSSKLHKADSAGQGAALVPTVGVITAFINVRGNKSQMPSAPTGWEHGFHSEASFSHQQALSEPTSA
ncbi:basic proline-rich protein-like [Oryctolagus cuniculus]|uniref:basic proline-rich protein-like n=1 Tax=Oryctolagus cuniculus TaxID=9986 RepID=UPI00387A7F77